MATRLTVLLASPRASKLGRKPSDSAARSTRSRLSADTGLGCADKARDAIARDTPASAATSDKVGSGAGFSASFMAAIIPACHYAVEQKHKSFRQFYVLSAWPVRCTILLNN